MLKAEEYGAFTQEVFERRPFPWQEELLEQVLEQGWPDAIDVPTGLGKTSTIDIAVFALAASIARGSDRLPTRLFFVIDRRIVVDSAFAHAEKLMKALRSPPGEVTRRVADLLRPGTDEHPLDVVRMRGGVTWGWRWARRPDQPLVVVGTVDQYGSRLLFRGYGVGPRLRPIDAALCGTDALVLVDEAHLCQPLLHTIRGLRSYEEIAPSHPLPDRPVRVTTLSATTNEGLQAAFRLTDKGWKAHLDHPVAGPRLKVAKRATLVELDRDTVKRRDQLPKQLAQAAQALLSDGLAHRVGVVVNTVSTARSTFDLLRQGELDAQLLVGRVRPHDRERLQDGVLTDFGAEAKRDDDTAKVLVATQTVEVGADLSFDALVTEAAPIDALIQRFGRVARRGVPEATHSVIVFAPAVHTEDEPVYGAATSRTWETLVDRGGPPVVLTRDQSFSTDLLRDRLDLGPAAQRQLLDGVVLPDLVAARPVAPVVLGPILDAWARTEPTPMPDQPVAPFLHGVEHPASSVMVCWRVDLDGVEPKKWAALVESLAPRAHELVEVPRRELLSLLADEPSAPTMADVAVCGAEGSEPTFEDDAVVALVYRGKGDSRLVRQPADIAPGDTAVLPSSVGGHDEWGWTGSRGAPVIDVAELSGRRAVLRLHRRVLAQFLDEVPEDQMDELERAFRDDDSTADEIVEALDELLSALVAAVPPETQIGEVFRRAQGGVAIQRMVPRDGLLVRARGRGRSDLDDIDDCDDAATSSTSTERVTLRRHGTAVGDRASTFAACLGLSGDLRAAVELAGQAHDIGKADPRFQALLFGSRWSALAASEPIAKSGRPDRRGPLFGWPEGMRHEALSAAALEPLDLDELELGHNIDIDLVVHLVATHHGWCRPLSKGVVDQSFEPFDVAVPGLGLTTKVADAGSHIDWEAPERFARLTERYGRWGLALLESIVRLADIACSEEGT